MRRLLRRFFLGKPLPTKALREERLTNQQALAVFGSDALSSTAYATEEILLVLVGLGTLALSASLPISLAIAGLVVIVALSYREVVHAYPQGGGVYNVAKTNLGETPALLGASSLIIDYILTATVSIAAGVAALTSAFPELFPYRVLIGILGIVLIMWMNLRGARSSGQIFSYPTYFFIAIMLITIGYGFLRFLTGTLPTTPPPVESAEPLQAIGLFILLRAFSAGCTALTGLEAISNGVKAFKSPESVGAAKTMARLAALLIAFLLGITFLAYQMKIVPAQDETVVSQIARTIFDNSPIYYVFQIGTFLILFLAANTPYADFPRLAAMQARDGYWPKQFSNLGSKLVFSQGILALSAVSILLLIVSGGYVHALIPLYAVGVFLGFSLTQLGMIVHDRRMLRAKMDDRRQNVRRLIINSIGFAATTVVFFIVLYSKFFDGAFLILPMIALLFFAMRRVRRYYNNVDKELSISTTQFLNVPSRSILAVVLISKLDRRAVEGARVARGLNPASVCAFHVTFEKEEGDHVKDVWEVLFNDIPIEVRLDEFREITPTILDYFSSVERRWHGKIVAVVPMLVPQQPFREFLHNQTAKRIIEAIRRQSGSNVEIYEVPVRVETGEKV
ncbi:MAG: APC family permease [Thaumarchaeota archaeon]|nr:APC family permease [Nitrososphaerota archaeon]